MNSSTSSTKSSKLDILDSYLIVKVLDPSLLECWLSPRPTLVALLVPTVSLRRSSNAAWLVLLVSSMHSSSSPSHFVSEELFELVAQIHLIGRLLES